MSKITWTKTDEAPALATFSLLPILRRFVKEADIEIDLKDISLASRILAVFPEYLKSEQKVHDDLMILGEMVTQSDTNIIKLPNISASLPQILDAVRELKEQGFNIPDYPYEASNEEEKSIQERYKKVMGSAVNPVLREGNSDRRCPRAVKKYAQKNPHRLKDWSSESKARVAHMDGGDFFGNEKSMTLNGDNQLSIEFQSINGDTTLLKEGVKTVDGEIVDATFMSRKSLREFIEREVQDCQKNDLLFSIHMKATMMKVSDPVVFGHAVEVYYKDVFEKHQQLFRDLKVNSNNGIGDVLDKIASLPSDKREEILKDIESVHQNRAPISMVDSDKGITNLHVPNNVIIDASMPVMIRDGGMMWNQKGELQQAKALIPDRTYATFYQAMIEDCRINGKLDVASIGSVSNVGLMAKKAQEYGSHPTTFVIPEDGEVFVKDQDGKTLMTHKVHSGDIWRMSRVQDIAVKDWVKLGVTRARLTNTPAIFWLDSQRAHDAQLIKKVERYLQDHDTSGLEIKILPPVEALRFSVERMRKGEDTISVTGNVLRDYLTDLFPILELGTSAKMLSIVPLLNGGGLFETGAGGSAPKHVEQMIKENHLRWDSLGEFLAFNASLEHIAQTQNNPKAQVLAECLDAAIEKFLDDNRSPSRKVNELDNRGSHFYLALYWSRELANQDSDNALKSSFKALYEDLQRSEEEIIGQLNGAQGQSVDLEGYFNPSRVEAERVMKPSATLNQIINSKEL